ncbi:MAG: anaerobic ribonucleoside-triphosphate reductase activating protein [Oscillospiraceae bacterium]|nr:anaerobic ribonucleoside-triphosphate reductase activating protein [Oscillospiraceae bacterium]
MFLGGIQKLSLLDYPGKLACTVFTIGCNLRCPYCHNSGLVLSTDFDQDTGEVLRFLESRRGLLDGVCVTGGEPLLHLELPDFLRRMKDMGYLVKLDTNGFFPERLRAVAEEGLTDMVAMDIKNGPSHYAETVGIPGVSAEPAGESRAFLLSGVTDYEFRTTVVRGLHTRESLLEAAEWIAGAGAWYLQQFRDSGALIRPEGLSAFSDEEMRNLLTEVQRIIPAAKLRGIDNNTGEERHV